MPLKKFLVGDKSRVHSFDPNWSGRLRMKNKDFFGIAVAEKKWVNEAGVEEFLKDMPKPLEAWSEACRSILIRVSNTSAGIFWSDLPR